MNSLTEKSAAKLQAAGVKVSPGANPDTPLVQLHGLGNFGYLWGDTLCFESLRLSTSQAIEVQKLLLKGR